MGRWPHKLLPAWGSRQCASRLIQQGYTTCLRPIPTLLAGSMRYRGTAPLQMPKPHQPCPRRAGRKEYEEYNVRTSECGKCKTSKF
jgi:hypothetical protein